jgi:hypothetical protein
MKEVKRMASKTEQITRPEQIAQKLGISGKVIRAHLRGTYPRPANAKNTSWSLTPKQVNDTLAHFKARQSNANEKS